MRWDQNAREWAAQEERETGRYDVAVARLGLGAGHRVLDVGCGSGVFLARAAAAGAEVSGVDAAPGLVEIARRRVAGADVRVADLETLPFEDARFDVVTGFNSFFFAADLVGALREAARVVVPGGRVLAQVWGDPERCDLKRLIGAVSALAGRNPPPSDLWRPGVLDGLMRAAGLEPVDAFDARVPLEYPDDAALLAGALSPPPIAAAYAVAGEAAVQRAALEALAPFRAADGSYRLHNEWRYVVAQRSGSEERP